MIVGIPKEIKSDEYTVSMTPAGVHELVENGHKVLVENKAGEGSGILDKDYLDQGAEVVSRDEAYKQIMLFYFILGLGFMPIFESLLAHHF